MPNPAGYVAPQTLRSTTPGSEFVDGEAGKILDPTARGGSASPVTLGPNEGQSSASSLALVSERTVSSPDSVTQAVNTPVAGTVRLTWNDPNSAEVGYEIQCSFNGGAWTAVTTTAASATTYDHATGQAAGTTVRYRIRATHASGNSTWAYTATATL